MITVDKRRSAGLSQQQQLLLLQQQQQQLESHLNDLFADRWTHLFIDHQYDNSLVIETTTASTSTHLNVLA